MGFGNRTTETRKFSSASGAQGGGSRPVVAQRGRGRDRRPNAGLLSGLFGGSGSGNGGGGSAPPPGGGDNGDIGSPGEEMVARVAMVIGVLAAVVVIGIGSMWVMAQSKLPETGVSDVLPLSIDLAIRRLPGAQLVRTPVQQKVNDTCLIPLSRKAKRKLGRQSAFSRRIARMGRGRRLIGMGRYLNCAMQRYKQRLCHDKYKQALLHEVLFYFEGVRARKTHLAMAKDMKQMMAPGTMMGDIMVMQRSFERLGNTKKKRRRAPPVPTRPAGSVVANLQKLIREGYLKQSDFGWFAPSAIRPYVEGVKTVGAACTQ